MRLALIYRPADKVTSKRATIFRGELVINRYANRVNELLLATWHAYSILYAFVLLFDMLLGARNQ